jgi:hypothetical protein
MGFAQKSQLLNNPLRTGKRVEARGFIGDEALHPLLPFSAARLLDMSPNVLSPLQVPGVGRYIGKLSFASSI